MSDFCAFCATPFEESGAGVAKSHSCEHAYHTQCLIRNTNFAHVHYQQNQWCPCGALLWRPPSPPASVAGSEDAPLEQLQNDPAFQEDLKKLKKKRTEASKTGTAASKVVKEQHALWKAAIQEPVQQIRSAREEALSSIKNNPATKEHKTLLTSYKTSLWAFRDRWGLDMRVLRSLLPNWGHVSSPFYRRSIKLRYFSLRSV